ncbi:MAG: hypothetical protein HF962_02760 [Sulfurovum sp.]|nr:hypothetical protein [Sulfurovum sp.]
MIRIVPVVFLLTISLFARFSAIPTIECEAFNNMKHTTNSNSVVLDTSKKYIVLKKYKGQYLLLLKGQNPAQRWVNSECFSTKKDKIIQIDKVSKK